MRQYSPLRFFKNCFFTVKNSLLLIFFLLTNFTVNAQPYQSIFGQHSTGWVFMWSNLPGTQRDSAYVEKDTIVGAYNYKKIVIPSTPFVYVGGLLREDTTTGKVWYKGIYNSTLNPHDTAETLIFDYSLQVGDSMEVGVYFNPAGATLGRVDSVKSINGRKYLFFSVPSRGGEPITFIEGIGGNCAVMKLQQTAMIARYLLCSYKDGIRTDYSNVLYQGSCNLPSGVNETHISAKEISVYPVPAKDILYINNNTGTTVSRAILSAADGRIVLNINASGIQQISLNGIAGGCYFLKLLMSDAACINYKVVVESR